MADLRSRLQEGLQGSYTIERELGRGGMATVYLAQDLRHDRPVAQGSAARAGLHPAPSASSGRSGWPPGCSTRTSSPCTIARAYILLGEQEKALDTLEPLLRIPTFSRRAGSGSVRRSIR